MPNSSPSTSSSKKPRNKKQLVPSASTNRIRKLKNLSIAVSDVFAFYSEETDQEKPQLVHVKALLTLSVSVPGYEKTIQTIECDLHPDDPSQFPTLEQSSENRTKFQ